MSCGRSPVRSSPQTCGLDGECLLRARRASRNRRMRVPPPDRATLPDPPIGPFRPRGTAAMDGGTPQKRTSRHVLKRILALVAVRDRVPVRRRVRRRRRHRVARRAPSSSSDQAQGQGRRDPPRHRLLGSLGDRRPPVPRRGLQGRGRRVRHPERQRRQGEVRRPSPTRCSTSGATSLLIVNLDSPSAATVINKAHDAGRPGHRLRPPDAGRRRRLLRVLRQRRRRHGASARASSSACRTTATRPGPVALLNGSPTDNNATLFKQGYEKAIKDAGYTVAADQSVPDWDNTKAGTIFEQMYTKANGNFVGVAAANDGLGGAVVAVLERNGHAGKIPTTGQDATDEGLQRVLLGTQCMTVYKAVKKEADAAAALAIALTKGDTAAADALATRHRRGHRDQASRSSRCCCSRRRSSRRTSRTSWPTASPPPTNLHDTRAEAGLREVRHQLRVDRRPVDPTPRPYAQGQPLLSLRGVNKSFGAVHVLRGVDLTSMPARSPRWWGQRRRQEHADQGRRRDLPVRRGRDVLRGRAGHVHGPKHANALGIEIVYQDLALCDNLDVVHNMFLGRELSLGSRSTRPRWRSGRATP